MNRTGKVLLVILRIVVGWHFLYEGVWKIASDDGAAGQQFASREFLQASAAQLRDYLNAPDRPTPQAAQARIDQWYDDVVRYFKSRDNQLSEEQKSRLGQVRDCLAEAVAEDLRRPEAAEIVAPDWHYIHEDVLKLAAETDGKRYFTSEEYLLSAAGPFRPLFRGLAPDADGLARLAKDSTAQRIEESYSRILRHFESRGCPFTFEQRTRLAARRDRLRAAVGAALDDPSFRTRIETYRQLLERVRRDAGQTTAPYSEERLAADRKRLDAIAAELLAVVNEPIAALASEAQALATIEQMKAGPPPRPPAQTAFIDWLIKWGLTAIGLCLILGLLTPVAAAAAAAQLAVFYFVSPPWPGLPAATMGGHYLYVDRNLIEMTAALVLAAMPTGLWAGLDMFLWPLVRRRRRGAPAAETAPVAV